MRDEDQGGITGHVGQTAQHLLLMAGIQRRGGLVGHHQRGAQGQGQGDHAALQHAAGQLMRIAVQDGLRQPHPLQGLTDGLTGPGRGQPRRVPQGPRQLLSQRPERIEGRHGLLQDDGHARAAQLPPARGIETAQVAAVEMQLPAPDQPGRQQAQQGPTEQALAAAALAHDAQTVPALQRKTHVPYQRPAGQALRDENMPQFQQRHGMSMIHSTGSLCRACLGSRASRRLSPR